MATILPLEKDLQCPEGQPSVIFLMSFNNGFLVQKSQELLVSNNIKKQATSISALILPWSLSLVDFLIQVLVICLNHG
jgi:hypothetical protein